ncbi:ABC transporter ATP-binding protein [uncultured Eubacterium sp.]|uniref:ABC transporter ATP-binding protein n=1 Tax=uncultured Eubacterium sp. TaxID=165185 RepID=UPI0015ADB489|nr:ABC transporter ATP-binding protein [uncultured Eubacterium sp.]
MKKQIKEILSMVWKYNRIWGGIKLLNAVLLAVLVPINTILFQKIIDDILILLRHKQITTGMYLEFGLFVAALLLDVILTSFDKCIEIRFDMKMTDGLERDIIQKYKNLDYSCYEKSATYDIISRISKNPGEKLKLIYWKLIEIIKILISLVGLVLVFRQASNLLIVIFILFLIPMLYENYKAGSLWYELYAKQTMDERKVAYYERLLTSKTSLIELIIYQATDYIKSLWEKQSEKMLKEKDATLQKVEKALLKKSLFATLWYICCTGILIHSVMTGHISVGLFIALFNTTLSIVGTITSLLETFGDFSKEIKEVSYISSFFELKNTESRTGRIDHPIRRIRFEHVSFAYPNSEKEVLHDANFEIDLSRSTALVGENGSGKTTIIKLLCGLYRPTKGRIMIDDQDLNKLSSQEIGKLIKVVFQDFYQYELTVRENIGFGNLGELDRDDKLNNALELVNLKDVKDLGLDRNLGKLEMDGVDLSKGQWQRLAVSRLFLTDTAYVILDEPTASMDPVSEYKMYQLFCSLMKSRGSLMISHRLASAKMADHILVLKHGNIIEQGNHDDLMKNQGIYYTLFCKQAEWYTA